LKTIIAILGGGVNKGTDCVWRSVGFDDEIYGAPGSVLRVLAACFLYKENFDSLILALGGKGQMKDIPDAPTLAEILKKELTELGVPDEKIIEEKNSGTTYQQLQELMKIAKEVSASEITIISNRYHLPRIRAMVEYAPLVKDAAGKINFASAEEILIEKKPEEWKAIVEKAYESAEMKELIKKEDAGALQVREGKYKFS